MSIYADHAATTVMSEAAIKAMTRCMREEYGNPSSLYRIGQRAKIKDDIVEDVKFETFGCGSAIASSSMATEMIKGKPLSEVKNLTNKAVTEALDGLPAHKIHCSVLAEEAIHSALEDYERRRKEEA